METIILKQKEIARVPKLRFREFDAVGADTSFKKYIFKDIFQFATGKNIKQSEASPEFEIPCIRYGELYYMYNEVIYEIINKTNLDKSELFFSKGDEILLPSAGEDPLDIGSASALTLHNIAIGRTINILRPIKKNIYSQIYASYFINQKLRKKIATLAKGSSISNVYNSDLKKLEIILPSLPEQEKIASFLSAVDKKIQQLTRKNELLESYKKSVMQQLFSQEIRFKDEDGKDFPEWDEKKLGEIAHRITLKNTEDKIKFVLTNSATQGIISQNDYFDRDIANQNNLQGYYVVSKNDFIYNPRISVHAPVGPIKRNKLKEGVMSPLYSVFRFKDNKNLVFFEYYFETVEWHKYLNSVANFGARHDRMNISLNDFYLMPLPFPCANERQKIADFLSAIDKKIEVVSQQIIKTESFKKGLLQQMFV